MDARVVLDQLLQSGRRVMDEGREVAEELSGVPESGEGREAMIKTFPTRAMPESAGDLLDL